MTYLPVKRNWWLIIIGLAILTTGAGPFVLELRASTTYTYEGKEVFYTEEDYGKFKLAIGQEEVDIQNTNILSSSPPIVAEYSVKVPKNYIFPYGEEKKSGGSSILHLIMLAIVFGSLGLMSLAAGIVGIDD